MIFMIFEFIQTFFSCRIAMQGPYDVESDNLIYARVRAVSPR